MTKVFQRKIEDFICEHCGTDVVGNGYTNHCPKCLWSKHVDINPGDRLGKCHGLMEPVSYIKKGGDFVINHKCLKCGFEKRNRTCSEDSFDEMLKISCNITV